MIEVLVEVGPFLLGLVLLVAGADRAVRAAGELALYYGVSAVVLALMYWRRGLDRPAAVLCLLLYLPSFFLL